MTGADGVHIGWRYQGLEIIPAGTAGDEYGGSTTQTHPPSGEIDFQFMGSTTVQISASNADGVSQTSASVWQLHPLGYANARIVAGGIPERYVNDFKNYLQIIDGKLQAGKISQIEALDAFNDPYLRGGLTADILAKMQNLLIYIYPWQLPPKVQADTDLCNPAYGEWNPNMGGVAICVDLGGDDLTLLHELYHFAAYPDHDFNNECKAFAVSMMAYDLGPPGCGPWQV